MKVMNKMKSIWLVAVAFVTLFAVSCDDDEESINPPAFNVVTTIKDMETSIYSGDMGEWIALQGANFETVDSVIFNDVVVNKDDIYYEDGVIYTQIPIKLPHDVTNKITVVTEGGNTSFDFAVNIPDLQMANMFNEYTLPGDTIKIYGKFISLYEIDSSNTVVSFGGIESPVIKTTENYITAQVPLNVEPDVRVVVKNNKLNVEAQCAGYYQDKHNVITTFDSDFPYTHSTGQQWVGEWESPKPTSGKYLRFEVDQETYPNGLGWFYIFESSVKYTLDMMQNPDKYTLKFELNMGLPIKQTQFFIYYYWAVAPEAIGAEYFTVMNMGAWQTVNIPLEKIIPLGYTGTSTNYSLNIRVENFAPVENVEMYFDNFRIYEEE